MACINPPSPSHFTLPTKTRGPTFTLPSVVIHAPALPAKNLTREHAKIPRKKAIEQLRNVRSATDVDRAVASTKQAQETKAKSTEVVAPTATYGVGAASLAHGGSAYIDYPSLPGADRATSAAAFEIAIEAEWTHHYANATAGERDIRSFTVGTFTWLWDATTAPGPSVAHNRLIGIYGSSAPTGAERDEGRIAKFPSPQRDNKKTMHRGHAAGHSIGGPDEGFNMFGQVGSVNLGRQWRDLERYCTKHSGTFMFMRAAYSDNSDQPTGLEYGVVRDGTIDVEYFDNF